MPLNKKTKPNQTPYTVNSSHPYVGFRNFIIRQCTIEWEAIFVNNIHCNSTRLMPSDAKNSNNFFFLTIHYVDSTWLMSISNIYNGNITYLIEKYLPALKWLQ